MKKVLVSLALPLGTAFLLQAGGAKATPVTVNIGGTDYTVDTFSDTLTNVLANPAYTMPWFGSFPSADDFAVAVNSQTGVVQTISPATGDIDVGPIFAFLATGEFSAWHNDASATYTGSIDPNTYYTFAVVAAPAVATPGPLPLLGAAAAFSASRRLRQRISAQSFKF